MTVVFAKINNNNNNNNNNNTFFLDFAVGKSKPAILHDFSRACEYLNFRCEL